MKILPGGGADESKIGVEQVRFYNVQAFFYIICDITSKPLSQRDIRQRGTTTHGIELVLITRIATRPRNETT
ncbi:hypothetical protein Bca101_003006 [Brassica carinata]